MADKPKGWTSKDLDFTDEMAGYIPKLAKLENDRKIGFRESEGKYFPYPSVEDDKGNPTFDIGFGHKIGADPEIDKLYDFDKGLTERQVQELLVRDTQSAYRRAFNSYKNTYGVDEWNRLSDKQKVALTDISFNIGNIQDYKGVFRHGDISDVKRQIMKRGATIGGAKSALEGRNISIIKDYIDPKDWQPERLLMSEWLKKDNLFK
jgi:hypothetical protein